MPLFGKKSVNGELHMKTVEAEAIKKRAIKSIENTTCTAEKLNKLLLANGITLKIYLAKGGHHD